MLHTGGSVRDTGDSEADTGIAGAHPGAAMPHTGVSKADGLFWTAPVLWRFWQERRRRWSASLRARFSRRETSFPSPAETRAERRVPPHPGSASFRKASGGWRIVPPAFAPALPSVPKARLPQPMTVGGTAPSCFRTTGTPLPADPAPFVRRGRRRWPSLGVCHHGRCS